MGNRSLRPQRGRHKAAARMRTVTGAVLVPCLVLAGHSDALALSLLAIRDFSQSAGFSTAFTRSDSSASGVGSERHREYTEDYGLSFDYSVLTPQLLNGKAILDLQWLQNYDAAEINSSSAQFQLRYNVFSQLLSRTPVPISVSTSSTRDTISPPFARSYQNETESLNARLAVQNALIPASMTFGRQSQKTSGLTLDTTQDSHNLNVSARPTLGEYGNVGLGVTLSDSDSSVVQTGQNSHSSSASMQAGYQGGWKSARQLGRNLSVNYGYHQSKGAMDFDTENLNGTLYWQLGKVMDANMTGYYSTSRAGESGTQSRGGSASLKHTLMGSLTTMVTVTGSNDGFQDGSNSARNFGLNLGYHKKLPRASHLDLGYSYSVGLTEHQGRVTSVQVLDELQAIPAGALRRIRLNHITFDPGTIKVVGVQSQLIYPASFYTTTAEGIEVVDSYGVDRELQISYQYRQDPSVTTLGTAHGISASATLFDSKYRIYADALISNQKLLEGDATALSLTATRHYDLGATATLPNQNASVEIGYDKNYAEDLYYFNGSWGHFRPYAGGDLSISGTERYTWQTTQGESMPWTNTIAIQTSYRRPFGNVLAHLKADYANALVQGGDMFHSATLGANLEGTYGRLTALLNTSAAWSYSKAGISSSQAIGISVRRSF